MYRLNIFFAICPKIVIHNYWSDKRVVALHLTSWAILTLRSENWRLLLALKINTFPKNLNDSLWGFQEDGICVKISSVEFIKIPSAHQRNTKIHVRAEWFTGGFWEKNSTKTSSNPAVEILGYVWCACWLAFSWDPWTHVLTYAVRTAINGASRQSKALLPNDISH